MKKNGLFFLLGLAMFLLSNCKERAKDPYRIFYINSYHQGYGSSDDIMTGLHKVLDDAPVVLEKFFMNTKIENEKEQILKKTEEALAKIEAFDPDIIIASDDDAVKYLIEPYFKNTKMPVIFCGVNWTADQYGLPVKNVTGMLEVLPIDESIDILNTYFPEAKQLLILSELSPAETKNKEVLDPVFRGRGLKPSYALVEDFEDWKAAFENAMVDYDVVYIPTNGAIKNWNHDEAVDFVAEHISKPVFTCDDFMMPYAVFGLTKIAEEQGEWSANAALNVLKGIQDISEIELTKNVRSKSWINLKLAEKVGFEPSQELVNESELIK